MVNGGEAASKCERDTISSARLWNDCIIDRAGMLKIGTELYLPMLNEKVEDTTVGRRM
jgi:hypothetical protein